MDSPFETPFTILEDEPEGRHTRALRPYVEKLINIDQEKPVHANSNNTFDILKHYINEEKLEYWVSDEEIGDHDTEVSEDLTLSKKRKISKTRKAKKKQKKSKKSHKLTHETQVVQDPELAENYHFNSREVSHIRQQMCLSLQARAKCKDQRKLPVESKTKDLKIAAISLSGLEPRLKPIYFKKKDNFNQISFIRFQSRLIDTLFYICLFKRKFKLCFKLFRIIMNTFGSDVYQMWTLGVHLLTELNITEFETNFEIEWKREFKSEVPRLSKRILKNLSFLQNPLLVPMLVCEDLDETIMTKLKETVSKKTQMQNHIIKFIRLLMRTSRNQLPISGGFPEQNFVPNGILIHEDGNNDVDDPQKEIDDNRPTKKERRSSNDNSVDEDSNEFCEKPIIIQNAEFNPFAETRQPNQHTYLKSLRRHSTPLHRLGSRTRTPTYTLTLLWILVRTGRIDTLQRIIEPLLLVVPTSNDARVALSEIMAKFMDVGSQIQVLSSGPQENWEVCDALERKMSDLNDSWARWKDRYTSKRKLMRNVRQYVQYDEVDKSLINLTETVRKTIDFNKQEIKKQESDLESTDESDIPDYEETNELDGNLDNEEEAEGEFVEWEDDMETQQELERLMGYAEMVAKDDDEDNSQKESDEERENKVKIEREEEEFEEWVIDDEEDEETQKELDRLMGYAEEVADDSRSDDDLIISEAEKFELENDQAENFQDAVEYQDSDSD
ncbi:hypothetical protein CANINC_000229 [Pichia inconspicua]|uniref:Uncharacterized protein n=1 Tax=Pichia inconspicua TaxID=52247 RepID=A0A4T0X8B0_9ASCO|nr:hypothetical protein CANINC_000229 [[Candida] inconspicua]